jgi:hypothetical protein
MKRRSWQMELPHIGDLPDGTQGARKSSNACSALSSDQGETRTRSISPERLCVLWFHWSMPPSTSSVCRIAKDSLCARTASDSSVITSATSMMRS